MPIDTTSTSGAPYFDDWSTSGNSAKNYLKILFQPGRSVQARELNQIQSGIQSQIDKLGSHFFKEGTNIIDGGINIDNQVQYIDLTFTANAIAAASDASRPLIGEEVYADAGSATPATDAANVDVKAVIVDYENISDNDYRVYLRYTSEVTTFDDGVRLENQIKIGAAVGSHLTQDEALSSQTTTVDASYALKISNEKGIYYAKGYFVETLPQQKYVTFSAKKTEPVLTINGDVGFLVIENNRSAVNDSTLYDNATGAPNYSAPGADRYTITLDLAFITDDSSIDSNPSHVVPANTANAISVVEVADSKIYSSATTDNAYNILGDNLAQRTFEESGDYALDPFELDLIEHLLVDGNRGKYQAGTEGGDSGKFIAALEPSVAYVKGKRVEVQSKQEIEVDKGRNTTLTETNIKFQAKFGNFIEVDDITFLPKADGTTTYTLYGNTNGSGTNIGTCNIRGIEYTGQIYKIYITNLSLSSGQVLRAAKSITGDADNNDSSNDFLGAKSSNSRGFELFDTNVSNEIFSLPIDYVKTLEEDLNGTISTTISIPVRLTLQNQQVITPVSGTDTVEINAPSNNTFYSDNPNDYIITKEDTGANFICSDVALSNSNGTATLTFNNDASTHVDVIASVRTAATKREKTKDVVELTNSVTINVDTVGNSVNIGSVGDDVINIFEVIESGVDYTEYFTLDNGQTATSYGQAKMVLSKLIPGLSGSVTFDTVKFCHLTAPGAGTGFFSVDSYPMADDQGTSENTANGNVARQEIPAPTGVSLLDCLDFRGCATLDPNGTIEVSSMTSYLPRHDRICIRSTGELEYVLGDAIGGVPAEVPDDAMLLYDLQLPPFVSSVEDIEIGYIENRRYTMRDIGAIEKRVKNLEYYSSLSLLEQSTKDKQIFDDAGERFKNGILVDEFKGFGVANTADPAYAMAMEPETGILRPTFTGHTFSQYLANNTADDNSPSGSVPMGEHDHVRIKASGFTDFIHQPFASTAINVNPFDVASFVGDLELSPSSDEWRETRRRPDVVVRQDQVNEAQLKLTNETLAAQGVRWNDWKTTWTGDEQVKSLGWHNSSGAKKIFGDEHNITRRRFRRSRFEVPGANGGTVSARTRNGQVHISQTSVDKKQIRTGIKQFADIQTIRRVTGNRVIDVGLVPFIRSRRVYFRATGLKPNTQMYLYFDGRFMNHFAQSTSFIEYRNQNNRLAGTAGNPIHNNLTDAVNALKTDNAGTLQGFFVIPHKQTARTHSAWQFSGPFRVGEREVVLTDRTGVDSGGGAVNYLTLDESKSYAKATYSARGTITTVQRTVVSTQRIRLNTRVTRQERIVNTVTDTVATKVRHVDPVAQTFLVDGDKYPGGVFIKDIDLYFKDLDKNLPVRIYLAPTQNGIPTQQIIPFSEVQKYPSRTKAVESGLVASSATDTEKDRHVVFGSDDASVATTFTFKSPIYLKPGTEYSVVVLSNSSNYTLWHSEVGGTDVTGGAGGQIIQKNPYTGVALKSANASTWTPDQTKDFKFTIRKFNFATGTSSMSANGYSTSFQSLLPTGVSATEPLTISAVNLLATTIRLPKTNITFNLALGSNNYTLIPGEVYELPTSYTIDASGDMVLTCNLTTQDANLTPMLDVNRLTIQTFSNVINKPTGTDEVSRGSTGEAVDGHGKASARYITKTTELANAASQMDVFLDVRRPDPACDVFVYARFDGSGQYHLLNNANIPISAGFKEVAFKTDANSASFTSFELKIVMVSDNIAVIPQCKNLRAIATA